MPGTLIISLDFELFWGVRDHHTIASYGRNILGARVAIPQMLDLFTRYELHATWATVGILFYDRRRDLAARLPSIKPGYVDRSLSPYEAIESIGEDETSDPYHFGRSLVRQISTIPGQEIGTHTFSHYYALERGQTEEAFRADLEAAVDAARNLGLEVRSLVFPRNQHNTHCTSILRELGLTCYRGNAASWMYGADDTAGGTSVLRRGARLVDAYVNVSGHHTYRLDDVERTGAPFNLPASRFLRPWSSRLHRLERTRLERIRAGMTHAARTNEVFHLWWHPHNFGSNLAENLASLDELARHFRQLHDTYQMESRSMGEVASRLNDRIAMRVP